MHGKLTSDDWDLSHHSLLLLLLLWICRYDVPAFDQRRIFDPALGVNGHASFQRLGRNGWIGNAAGSTWGLGAFTRGGRTVVTCEKRKKGKQLIRRPARDSFV